jgi:protein-S-isoprenylcysteine O-methyltransferase Ste14
MNESTPSARPHAGLLPPKALLLSLIAQLPLLAVLWPPRPHTWQIAAGVALVVAGSVLNVRAERLFRKFGVGVCPFTHAPRVVVEGPFRISRHPMYLGLVFLSVGACLASGVLWNLWAPSALFAYLHVRFVLREEEFLVARLGTEYVNYRDRHPRWLGFPPRDQRAAAPVAAGAEVAAARAAGAAGAGTNRNSPRPIVAR